MHLTPLLITIEHQLYLFDIYPNGEYYIGKWYDNAPNGNGEEHKLNGEVVKGEFEYGRCKHYCSKVSIDDRSKPKDKKDEKKS